MYIDNEKLSQELTDWKKQYNEAVAEGLDPPQINNYIARSIMLIAENYAKKHQFNAYTYKDEMIGDAILEVLKGLKNFNHEAVTKTGKVNAFWYISQTVHNAFIRRIPKEQKQQQIKNKALIEYTSVEDMTNELEGGIEIPGLGDQPTDFLQNIYNDHFNRYMEYEKKLEETKDRKSVVSVVKEKRTDVDDMF